MGYRHSTTQLLKKIVLVIPLLIYQVPSYADQSTPNYFDLPLEKLLDTEITSVSKKKQQLDEVASAVYVISQQDIKRSGVTSIPQALRMAPGIQVSRIDSSRWAITSRGFAGQYSNKLLVMIDGKTVYIPSYSGVYWDAQDTLLDDIERIEVIRGPGASIWGANAVNGVINIITKSAQQTQGTHASMGSGNEEKLFFNLRHGFKIDADHQARTYLKYTTKDDSYNPGIQAANYDSWHTIRAGFRIDGKETSTDTWTLQGDIYDNKSKQLLNLWQDPNDSGQTFNSNDFLAENTTDRIDSSGLNLLFRWEHELSNASNTSLQVYYDHLKRSEIYITQIYDTFDVEFQHQYSAIEGHDLIWGFGFRHIRDHFDNTFNAAFTPDSDNSNLFSAFIQDEIELLAEKFFLTIGTKYEHNQYSGNEIQPNIRLLWKFENASTLWGAISRAVRTPSRMEYSGHFVAAVIPIAANLPPISILGRGSNDFKAEPLLAYELGYRIQAKENLSFDFAAFYNDYKDLQSFSSLNTSYFSDFEFSNNLDAHSYGFEIASVWQLFEWWKLQSNYSYIKITANLNDDNSEFLSTEDYTEGSFPRHQFSIRSSMDLKHGVSLDLWLYYNDELQATNLSAPQQIDSYYSFNARVAWQLNKNWEVSLVGHNIFDSQHPEFYAENILTDTEVERSIYAQIRWEFE